MARNSVQGDGTLSGALAASEGMKQRTYVAGAFKYHQGSKAGSIGYEEEQSTTFDTGKAPAVCMADTQSNSAVDEELSGTLTRRAYKDAPVVGRMVVRRLTPTECERLQGFPDGYTDIKVKCTRLKDGGYKATEVDETPDTPRYKALGNSFAVPVVRWIGERIQRQEER